MIQCVWYKVDYFDQIEWVKGSFSDIDIIIETLKKVTTVFHCGAKVSFHPRDAKELYVNNLKATRDLISLCVELGVKNFIYGNFGNFEKSLLRFSKKASLPSCASSVIYAKRVASPAYTC